jgi:catechol 2,3-dioxygenase-like lactoylglutathione lyase family enzyme
VEQPTHRSDLTAKHLPAQYLRAMKLAQCLFAVLSACFFFFYFNSAAAQSSMGASPAIKRPPIVGVAHIGLKTADLAADRKFYTGLLGFQEPFNIEKPDGSGLALTYFKVNDHQYIEVFPTLKDPQEDRLSHISFETTDAEQLREYLASKGIKVPDKLPPRRDHDLGFDVIDPDGHDIEFMQYVPGSLHEKSFGKFMPATRISTHIIHVGFIVTDQAAEYHFYHDILGFNEFWHGGMTDTRTNDWVDMRVPDGKDWLEFMQNVKDPNDVHTRGVMDHLALGTPSAEASYQELLKRGLAEYAPNQEKPKIGRDGKWQLNLYDPDLTRVEMMEPKPVEKPCCSPMLQ